MPLSSQEYLEQLRLQRPAFYEDALSTAQKEDPEHGAWSVAEQFANGFINGFTTLDVGSDPVTGAERISRSLGHLLGFVGYIPGPGLVGKLGATGLARGSGIIARTIRGAELLRPNLLPGSLGGIPLRSVPMLGADLIMQGLKSSVGKMALMDSFKLAGGKQLFGRTVKDMVEGGLHLGFASAISARPLYQLELDDRWEAFWSGAPAGAAFRLMGNAVNKGGLIDLGRLAGLGESAGRRANAIARAFSGAAFMGLPSTMREDPLELQMYEYLLGAYFGGMEMSSTQRRVLRDLSKHRTGAHAESALMDPEKLPEWKQWNPAEREEALYQAEMMVGRFMQTGIDGFRVMTPAEGAVARAKYGTVTKLLEEAGGDYNVVAEVMRTSPSYVRRMVLGERLNERAGTLAEKRQEEIEAVTPPPAEEVAVPRAPEPLTREDLNAIYQQARKEVAEEVRVETEKQIEAQKSVSVFFDTLNKVMEREATFGESEIDAALKDADVNSSLRVPLSRLAGRLARDWKPEEGGVQKSQADVRREIYETARETLSKEGAGFEEFRTRLEQRYKFTLEGEEASSLKQMWNFVKVARPINVVEWVAGEGMRELKQVNALGKPVDKYGAPSPLDEVLGRTERLETIRTGDVGRWMIDSLYKADGKDFPWHKVLLWSALSDRPFVAGIKDTPSLVFGEWMSDLANPAERASNAALVLSRLSDIPGGRKAYEDGLADFLSRFKAQGNLLDAGTAKEEWIPQEMVKKHFDALWAQNLLLLERLNGGISFEDILQNKGGKFVNTWVDFNKRMQVLATGAIPVEESALDLWDVKKYGGLRSVIVRATGYADDTKTWERETDEKGIPTGFATLKSSETSRDGGVFVRRDVFDRLMQWAGGDPLAGFEKSHQFHVDPVHGAFLSKRGVHKADAELDKWMQENELHSVEFTTTAKQRGRRKVTGLSFDPVTGKHTLEDPLDEVAFSLPVSSIRHNATTRETVSSQLKEQHAVVQMFYNITVAQGGKQAIQDIADQVLLPAWRGEAEVNRRVDELLKQDSEALRASLAESKVDIDAMDGAKLLSILRGSDARPTALWKHLFEQLMGRYEEARSVADEDGVHSETYAEFTRSVSEIRSAADKLFALWEESPLTALNPITDRMFDTVLWSYLRERVTSPKVANSMKAYIVPHSPFVRAKYPVEQGTFRLAGAARSKTVTIEGEKYSLGEVWDKAASGDARMQAFLSEDFYVVRVPSDSASGTRTLKFRGFVDEADGTGIFLHDLDMRAVGGADTDGDSAFIYHSRSLPKSMHDFYSRPEIQNEWYEDLPTRDGQRVRAMKDALETKELQQAETFISRESKNPLSFGNPVVGLFTNRSAAVANSQLGPGLSLMRSVLTHLDMKILNNPSPELEKVAARARDYKRAIVNGAADAAGGKWLKEQSEIRKMMEESFGMDVDLADRFSKLTAVLKGHDADWQRPYTIDEAAYLLDLEAPAGVAGTLPLSRREVNTPEGKKQAPYPSLWFYAADVLAQGLKGVQTDPWLLVDRKAVEAKHAALRELQKDPDVRDVLTSSGRKYLANAPNDERFAGTSVIGGQPGFVEGLARGEETRYNWTIPDRIEFDRMPKYLRNQFVRHMIFQDGMDVATAKTLHGIVTKWREETAPARVSQMASRIRDEVEKVKYLERGRQRKAREESIASGVKPAASTFDNYLVTTQRDGEAGSNPEGAWWKSTAKWVGYRNLPPIAQMYYSAYAVGSLFQQKQTFPTFMREWRKSFELPEGIQPESEAAARLRQVHEAKGATAWHDRSWNASGLKLPFIAPEAVSLVGQSFHEFFYREGTPEDFKRWLTEDKTPLSVRLSPDLAELRYNLDAPRIKQRFVELRRIEEAHRQAVSGERPPLSAEKKDVEQEMLEIVDTDTPEVKLDPVVKDYAERIKALASVQNPDPKVEREIQETADVLQGMMYRYPWLIKYFDGIFAETTARQHAYGVGSTPGSASMRQMRQVLYEFQRKGFLDESVRDKGLPLPRRAYFMWPEKLDEYLASRDTKIIPNERRMVFDGGTIREMETYSILSHQGYLNDLSGRVIRYKDDEVNSLRQELHDRLSTLYHLPGEVANDFFRYAQAYRERGRDYSEQAPDVRYQEEYAKAMREMADKYSDYPLTRMEKGVSKKVTAREVLESAVQMQTEWAERMGKLVRDPAVESALFSGALDKDGFLNIGAVIGRLTSAPEFPAFTWNALKRMREWQVVLRLPVRVREDARSVAKVRDHVWEEARVSEEDGVRYREIELGQIGDLAYRRMMYRRAKADPDVNVNGWMNFRDIELLDSREYFPHLGWPEKLWKEHHMKGLRADAGKVEPWRLEREMASEIERMQTLTADGGMGNYLNEALLSTGMTQRDIVEAGLSRIPRNLMHRSVKGGTTPGYDKTARAFGEYQKQLAEGRWNLLYSVISHETIRSFERERPLGDHTEAWAAFMRQEVASILGLPSVYPREMADNPAFKIKNNPYWFFTDQHWLDLAKSLGIRFGKGEESLISPEKVMQEATQDAERILGRTIRKGTVTPEEAQAVDVARKARMLALARKLNDARMVQKFSWLSNLEAKFQLVSLLTHTKTAIANVFGGSLNTAVSAGFEPWRKAGNFQFLKDKVFQGMEDIRSMKDIEAFVEKHGGVESFVAELAARGVAPASQLRAFMDEVQAKAVAPKESVLAKTTLLELVKKHGLSDRMMDWASVFMRTSERAVRRRSWMAHYLRARDVLDVNGVTVEADHPWLVEMARRGTEASQFLYNSAARPMFARTSAGKVFARFQLWAWNSIKFRNEIFARARIGGFTPGTPEFDRFKRMAVADLFVMGLAGLFPTSLFGASLPAPYSYLQDMASYFFGDDREKDRAFYGTLPYPLNITKLGMPPAARLLDPAFLAITGGEWDKFASHTVWTYFPFGRLAKGLTKTIENPTMVAENMFGIPLHEAQSRIRRDEMPSTMPFIGGFWGKRKDDLPSSGLSTPPQVGLSKRDYERLEESFERVGNSLRKLMERENLLEDE